MKIEIIKNGTFEAGDCHVIGKEPKDEPYVWIGDGNICLAVLEKRQMNLLIKQWEKANKVRAKKRFHPK